MPDRPMRTDKTAPPSRIGQSAAAVTPVLDPMRRALLASVLDRIVPERAGLPGAGALGVADAIDGTLSASTSLRRIFLDGLTRIELAAAPGDFRALSAPAQDALLRVIEDDDPTFFAALVDHTYRGYYQLPLVHALIGWESRPPQPLGHVLPPFDPAILAHQRTRVPFWRKA